MTELDVASSDATKITYRMHREGDEYIINGHKVFGGSLMNKKPFVLHWWFARAQEIKCLKTTLHGYCSSQVPYLGFNLSGTLQQ